MFASVITLVQCWFHVSIIHTRIKHYYLFNWKSLVSLSIASELYFCVFGSNNQHIFQRIRLKHIKSSYSVLLRTPLMQLSIIISAASARSKHTTLVRATSVRSSQPQRQHQHPTTPRTHTTQNTHDDGDDDDNSASSQSCCAAVISRQRRRAPTMRLSS